MNKKLFTGQIAFFLAIALIFSVGNSISSLEIIALGKVRNYFHLFVKKNGWHNDKVRKNSWNFFVQHLKMENGWKMTIFTGDSGNQTH